MRRNAAFFGGDDAVVDVAGGRWSWDDLHEWSSRLANAFAGLGLGLGDVAAILAPNCATYLAAFFACSKSGVVGAPLNIRLTPGELRAYLDYVGPRALLVHASVAQLGRELGGAVAAIEHVVGFGDGHELPLDLDGLCAEAATDDPDRQLDASAVYMLAATSGTTGVPKAAVLTNANALAAIACYAAELPIAEGQTVLQNIPLFFNPGGPAGLHPALAKGGRTVICPGFEPATFLDVAPLRRQPHDPRPDDDPHGARPPRGGHGRPVDPALGDLWRVPRLERAHAGGPAGVRGRLLPDVRHGRDVSCGLVLRPQHQRPDGDDTEIRRLGSAGKPHLLVDVARGRRRRVAGAARRRHAG